MLKVAVLVSGGGSNLQSLIDFKGNYEIKLVVSDRKKAYGLERAKNHGIESVFVPKEQRTETILSLLEEKSIDFVVLAGFLSIIDEKITEKYKNRVINIHPSLIPKYSGMGFYGENVHKAVFEAKEQKSGATVHFVDTGVDTGEIILQKEVDISECKTSEEIAKKVLKIEHEILPKVLENIAKSYMTGEKNESIN